jgi:hypothetical protein
LLADRREGHLGVVDFGEAEQPGGVGEGYQVVDLEAKPRGDFGQVGETSYGQVISCRASVS